MSVLVFAPMFADVESAVDWFVRRGYEPPLLWRGPDGSVRGSSRLKTNLGMCLKGLHAMVGDNVYREPHRPTVRHCNACRRERMGGGSRLNICGTCGDKGHNSRTCRR